MSSIRVEAGARRDPRFIVLGKKLGTTRFDALGRMIAVWAFCTETQQYFLLPEIIDACAELEGFHALLLLPEVDLAEKTEQGIRIKGTRGRIEWLKNLRKSAKKGGKARILSAQRSASGRLVKSPAITPAIAPAIAPAIDGGVVPAPSSVLIPIPILTIKTKKKNISGEGSVEPCAVTSDEALSTILVNRGVTAKQWGSWIAAYPDPGWIAQEVKKAAAWEISNPSRRKKHFAAFIARWLGRTWDTRARVPSAPPAAPFNQAEIDRKREEYRKSMEALRLGIVEKSRE